MGGFSNGNYSRFFNWTQDANAGIDILPGRMDTEDTGFATGLSTCLLKDGTQTVTANIPFAGFRLTGVGAATSLTDAAQASQVQNSAYTALSSVAGTNTITASTTPTFGSYAIGQAFRFIAVATNTGATTININSIGAIAIEKKTVSGLAACSGSEIIIGQEYEIFYDGTFFQINATTALTFTSISSGTNTTAAMVVGSGASLAASGSGTITATTNANLTGGVTSVGNAATVVTNANLTGLVTSVGNATSLNLSSITNSLANDITITTANTYYDGPSVAQGSTGTWFVSGTVTCADPTSGGGRFAAKLWDGTTLIATGANRVGGSGDLCSISLSGFLATPAGNLRISVTDTSNSGVGTISSNGTGNSHHDSTITAFRIA